MLTILFSILASIPGQPNKEETHPVCIEVCDDYLSNGCVTLKATETDGQVEDLKVPDGKIIIREVKCE